MRQYVVVLRIEVCAESKDDAAGFAESAAEHLFDTFNDDESIVRIEYSLDSGDSK